VNSGGLVILKTINIVYHCDLYFNIIQPQIEKNTCVYILTMCIQCFYTLKDRIWFKYLIAVKVYFPRLLRYCITYDRMRYDALILIYCNCFQPCENLDE